METLDPKGQLQWLLLGNRTYQGHDSYRVVLQQPRFLQSPHRNEPRPRDTACRCEHMVHWRVPLGGDAEGAGLVLEEGLEGEVVRLADWGEGRLHLPAQHNFEEEERSRPDDAET